MEGAEYAEYDLFRLDGSGRGAATEVGDTTDELGKCGREDTPPAFRRSRDSSFSAAAESSMERSGNASDSGRGMVGERGGTISTGRESKYDFECIVGGACKASTAAWLEVSILRHLRSTVREGVISSPIKQPTHASEQNSIRAPGSTICLSQTGLIDISSALFTPTSNHSPELQEARHLLFLLYFWL